MKRRTVTQREEAEAREKARQHQGALLDALRAREAARREPSAPAVPAVPTAGESDESAAPGEPVSEEPEAEER